MKFTPEQRGLIQKTRSKIIDLNNQQTKLYDDLLKELDVSIYAEDWMFDYIYNEYGSIEDIEAKM
jgi:hypothetical protein